MTIPELPGASGRRDRAGIVLAIAIGAAGLMMMHHPMLVSGLGRIQVDLADSRLINYLLEHNYLWYLQATGHERFWDPPFFYPARNIAAYSDTMLGIAPLYGIFRAVGLPPDTAFQLWILALSALNYAAMFHLLSRRLGFSLVAASAGAFLFAFGSPRVNMLAQQTQLTQFLSLVSVDALFGVCAGQFTSRAARAAAWLVAAGGMMAQLSSAYYPGWFMVLGFGVVSILALWIPTTRARFLATLGKDAPWIALAGTVAAVVMRPWLEHHLEAARLLGPRWTQWVYSAMPRPGTWFETGPRNWIGGAVARMAGYRLAPPTGLTTPLGVGAATTLAAVAGLYLARARDSTRLLAVAGIALVVCLTILPEEVVYASKTLLIFGCPAFGYAARRRHPRAFQFVVALALVLVEIKGTVADRATGFGIYALVMAASAFVGRSGEGRDGLILGSLTLGLVAALFRVPIVLGLGLACGAAMAGVVAVLGRRSRRWIEGAMLCGFLGLIIPLTYANRPPILWIGGLAPLAMVAARYAPFRPPGSWTPHLALVGLAAEVMFEGGTAWMFFYLRVPGASSMIFVSRIGLIVLIPAAIGLAHAVDALRARGRHALALALALICMLEQGTTTPSFDKQANRAVIGSIARRVDPGAGAFFYTPADPINPVLANLDAMWAGLERGQPTVNGYSGHTPKGWRDVDEPGGYTPWTLWNLVPAFDRWKLEDGRSVPRVQWIGGPTDQPGLFPKVKPPRPPDG